MPRPTNPTGVRRPTTYRRNGKTVHAGPARIKRRQAPKRRLNAGARRRVQRKPMLYAAGTLAGLGALDAILTGRWGGAIVLGSLAGGFLLGHLVWSRHQNRQARKPARPPRAKPTKAATEQRREALEKAREAHQAEPVSPPVRSGEARAAWIRGYRDHAEKIGFATGVEVANRSLARQAASKEPASHEEWQTLNGKQCDCTKCRAKRKTEKSEVLR